MRTAGEPLALASAVEQTIHSLNPDLPLYNVSTLQSNLDIGDVFERIAADFAAAFGLMALILAAVGIYGVVAYTTRQRTHEIGIRMALGAGQGDVFRSVLRQGMGLALLGLAGGLIVSLAFTRLLRGMLFGVGAVDWFTLASVAAMLFWSHWQPASSPRAGPLQSIRCRHSERNNQSAGNGNEGPMQ